MTYIPQCDGYAVYEVTPHGEWIFVDLFATYAEAAQWKAESERLDIEALA